MFPRLDLPAFDERKAAALSPEKRAAYEQELFSQLSLWNMGSKHYPGTIGIERREERWLAMAADGFELAHITLQVLQPSSGTVYSLRSPMSRLETLAESGDVGAMCLMVGMVTEAAAAHDWRPYQPTYTKWLDEGSRRGHPECLIQRGGRLLNGTDGYPKDVRMGLELLFAGARAGYADGAGILFFYYRRLGPGDKDKVKRALCWASIADQFSTGERDSSHKSRFLDELEKRPRTGDERDWKSFLAAMRTTAFTLSDCIKLGPGD